MSDLHSSLYVKKHLKKAAMGPAIKPSAWLAARVGAPAEANSSADESEKMGEMMSKESSRQVGRGLNKKTAEPCLVDQLNPLSNSWSPGKTVAAAAVLGLAFATGSVFGASVGQPAPAFTLTDTAGKTVSLADFKGKHVVLEWVNPHCPFVVKHYGGGNMQATQSGAASKGVVWLAINSTSADHQDYKAPNALDQWMKTQKAAANHTLMDAEGKAGKAYAARTTPHMYIINPAGTLVYAGGIDNKPTANPADIAGATNYVNVALQELLAGKPVSSPNTRPYGCSVKYSAG